MPMTKEEAENIIADVQETARSYIPVIFRRIMQTFGVVFLTIVIGVIIAILLRDRVEFASPFAVAAFNVGMIIVTLIAAIFVFRWAEPRFHGAAAWVAYTALSRDRRVLQLLADRTLPDGDAMQTQAEQVEQTLQDFITTMKTNEIAPLPPRS